MQNFIQKWAIVALLEPLKDGTEFSFKDWPEHITIASVFAVDCSIRDLFNELSTLLITQKTINLEIEQAADWGKNSEIPVFILQKTPQIMDLHTKIANVLQVAGAVFNEPEYINGGFIPHCTKQSNSTLNIGDTICISSISIVDMFPNKDGYMRRITKTIFLNPKN